MINNPLIKTKEGAKFTFIERDFLINNYEKYSNSDLIKILNWNLAKLQKVTHHLALKRKRKPKNLNVEQIQSMNSPQIIYLLGLIWADGHLAKKKKKNGSYFYSSITLSLVKKDFKEIEPLLSILGKSSVYDKRYKKGKTVRIMYLSDVVGCEFLAGLGYASKSYLPPIKLLSMIPKNLLHYWWRGFFDGDGCISLLKNVPHSVFIAGRYDFDWLPLIENLKQLGLNFKVTKRNWYNKKTQKYEKVSYLITSRRLEMIKFLDFIYQNRSNDTIGLTRKYKKYLKAIKYNQTNPIRLPSYVYYNNKSQVWFFRLMKNQKILTYRSASTKEAAETIRNNYFLQNKEYLNSLGFVHDHFLSV